MARLFLSLYVFIALSLIALSAGLEYLFFSQDEQSKAQQFKPLIEVAKQQHVQLPALLQQLNLPYKRLSINDIAWSAADLNTLNKGQAILLSADGINQQLYIHENDAQLLEISLPVEHSDSHWFRLYSLAFFILLGAVIALWIWPLWRDISRLEKTVVKVLPDGSIATNSISKNSLIFPIATALNTMQRQIRELLKSQRELSGAITHEFRTPLARLKFALAMQPDNNTSTWQDMQQDVQELEQLVQEMLDYASTDARAPEMNLAEIPIKQLCFQLLERIKQPNVDNLQIQLKGVDAMVLADEHYIERAIANLVLNAKRYANQAVQITITAQQKNIQIAVDDDGKGVAPEQREKVFAAFYRPDQGRDRQQGGAGLGLAIVKRIVDWHQGQCFVTDSPLGGARFVILLPNPFKP